MSWIPNIICKLFRILGQTGFIEVGFSVDIDGEFLPIKNCDPMYTCWANMC